MTNSVVWIGNSGQEYNFELYELGTTFKDLGGVYVFCKPSRPGFFKALYVGQTQSFVDRLNTGLQNHDGFERAFSSGATHVSVLIEENSTVRFRIETDLRHGITPPCNEQGLETIFGSR